jgi:quercetin dioxygenase-like cupin family protein
MRHETDDDLDTGSMPRPPHQRHDPGRRGGNRHHEAPFIGKILDPTTGPSTFILKAPPGCVVPWHFHTAEEQLIIISGTVLAEMGHHPPARLGPGGFAMMGGHMPHQFTCQGRSACLMIVAFDRAYDIYWGKGG